MEESHGGYNPFYDVLGDFEPQLPQKPTFTRPIARPPMSPDYGAYSAANSAPVNYPETDMHMGSAAGLAYPSYPVKKRIRWVDQQKKPDSDKSEKPAASVAAATPKKGVISQVIEGFQNEPGIFFSFFDLLFLMLLICVIMLSYRVSKMNDQLELISAQVLSAGLVTNA